MARLKWEKISPKDASIPSSINWNNALNYYNNFRMARYTAWCLPNALELFLLSCLEKYNPSLSKDHLFNGIQPKFTYDIAKYLLDQQK